LPPAAHITLRAFPAVGVLSLFLCLFCARIRGPQWIYSLYLTWVLGLVNAAGYFVVVAYLAVNEVPIAIRETDQWVEDCRGNPSVRKNHRVSAFNVAGVTFAGTLM
jgi:hypothetical protein